MNFLFQFFIILENYCYAVGIAQKTNKLLKKVTVERTLNLRLPAAGDVSSRDFDSENLLLFLDSAAIRRGTREMNVTRWSEEEKLKRRIFFFFGRRSERETTVTHFFRSRQMTAFCL